MNNDASVTSLPDRKDVFAVLPIGFGKSLIYQNYALARNILDGRPPLIPVSDRNSSKQHSSSVIEEWKMRMISEDNLFKIEFEWQQKFFKCGWNVGTFENKFRMVSSQASLTRSS